VSGEDGADAVGVWLFSSSIRNICLPANIPRAMTEAMITRTEIIFIIFTKKFPPEIDLDSSTGVGGCQAPFIEVKGIIIAGRLSPRRAEGWKW